MEENNNEIIITCEKHPSQIITHICCLDNCLSPLCVKCMKHHNLYHKQENVFPEIETVEDVREFCCEKLMYIIEKYNNELDKVKQIGSPRKPDQNLQKLKFYREKLLSFINQYFNDLEEEYEKNIKFNSNEYSNLNNLFDDFQNIVKKLETFLSEIKYKCTLETLQHILIADYQNDYDTMKMKNDEIINNFLSKKMILIFDDSKINHILAEVENIAAFNFYTADPNKVFNQNKLIFDTMRTPMTTPAENSLIASSKEYSTIKNEGISDFQIKNSDYFFPATTAKFLHFFQQKSKFLHIFNLEDLRNNIVKEYKLEINVNFKIPRWHRSIALPNGEIYLFGGVVVSINNQEKTSNEAYKYDFETNTLKPIEPMKLPRSGHGIAYMNEKIYCVGGYTNENICSKRCEKYNISTNTWEEIGNLNYEANNACVCSFQNRFLFKFGGKLAEKELNDYIEKYCPIENIWGIIHVKSNYKLNDFSLLSSSACCQINQNQIFVFGGTYEDYSLKSNQSFLFEIIPFNEHNNSTTKYFNEEKKDLYIIKNINEKPLPFKEGFWNNHPIIYDSEIYCLQNIPNKNNLNVVYNDRRKILKFDFKGNWVSFT